MRLPPLFPENVAGLASAADPWRGARRACQSNQRGRSRSTTGSRVVVDAETVDNFTACLLRSLTERELRERFLGGQWSTIHNASNIVYATREIGVRAVGAASSTEPQLVRNVCVCEWLLLSTISVVLLLTLQVPVAKHLPFASLAPDASSPGGRGPAPHGAGQTV